MHNHTHQSVSFNYSETQPGHRNLSFMLCLLVFTVVSCHPENGGKVAEGMTWFPGGQITIGTTDGLPNEGPPFTADVDPFYISTHPVTVAEFRIFVEDTGYVTEAEKFGNSAVLGPDGSWSLLELADWRHPRGPENGPADDSHPVTHVSWNDAMAYADWTGKRLPTEIEWEYAAKGGRDSDDRYSWGDELVADGEFRANVWQGNFPVENRVDDGFEHTSPVGAFGSTASGLTDMGGNVWEWTADTYRLYEGNRMPFRDDPDLRVIRGGSFLCEANVCHGYRVTARQFNSRESAAFHMGFRTAMDVR
jgi:formylglycine-generating enzyme